MQYLCSTVLLTALSLLIRVGDYWSVWKEVGKEVGFLKAKVGKADKLLPPVNGWEYYDGGYNYQSDPTMVCSRQVSLACREVIVELKGDAKKKYPESAGRYLPVEGEHQRGRPVGSFEYHFNKNVDIGLQFKEKNLEVSLEMVIKVIVTIVIIIIIIIKC